MMLDVLRRRGRKAGQPPGALVYVGVDQDFTPQVDLVSYGPGGLEFQSLETLSSCPDVEDGRVHWLRVRGVHEAEVVKNVGETFGIHPLALEDILNTGRRPKAEWYGNALFAVLKLTDYDAESGVLVQSQAAMVWMGPVVLTFQEGREDVFARFWPGSRIPGAASAATGRTTCWWRC
ncbi:MAG: CorA family divalent cation transporter [Desulfovibrionaceae bacterium]